MTEKKCREKNEEWFCIIVTVVVVVVFVVVVFIVVKVQVFTTHFYVLCVVLKFP